MDDDLQASVKPIEQDFPGIFSKSKTSLFLLARNSINP